MNIASIYGFMAPRFELYEGTDFTSPVEYSAIKGGLLSMTKYLASYLGKHGIRVNALSPGGIHNHQDESFVSKYSSKTVIGNGMAVPDDLTGGRMGNLFGGRRCGGRFEGRSRKTGNYLKLFIMQ